MKLIEILNPDFIFEDERGLLCQITHESFAQVNAVFTKKGAQRGNFHYHKTAKEYFFVLSGKFRVYLSFDGKQEVYDFKTGDMFAIPENVRHSFDYIEDTYLVVFYSSEIELGDGKKDIIADEEG